MKTTKTIKLHSLMQLLLPICMLLSLATASHALACDAKSINEISNNRHDFTSLEASQAIIYLCHGTNELHLQLRLAEAIEEKIIAHFAAERHDEAILAAREMINEFMATTDPRLDTRTTFAIGRISTIMGSFGAKRPEEGFELLNTISDQLESNNVHILKFKQAVILGHQAVLLKDIKGKKHLSNAYYIKAIQKIGEPLDKKEEQFIWSLLQMIATNHEEEGKTSEAALVYDDIIKRTKGLRDTDDVAEYFYKQAVYQQEKNARKVINEKR